MRSGRGAGAQKELYNAAELKGHPRKVRGDETNMIRHKLIRGFLLLAATASLLLPCFSGRSYAQNGASDTVLKAANITAKIFPETVFYRGQVAPTQMRNTGGVKYADGFYVLAGLVDNSGYSTAVRQKYQGYFLAEVPVEINGQELKPGAYGIGFVEGEKFIVTDIGANALMEIAGGNDKEIKHPTPLQVIAGPDAGNYRLYLGRDYVTIHRGS